MELLWLEDFSPVYAQADQVRAETVGDTVHIRALLEISNHCWRMCTYCGLRAPRQNLTRYRMDPEEVVQAACEAHAVGYRTIVLQSGEDPWFTDERVCQLVRQIKTRWPEAAVTLSIGERSRESYQAFFDAGADRYLLRHETFNGEHYSRLHPPSLSAARRQQCLWDLKDIGYQVGTGFMVGSPFQTPEHLAEDLLFIEKLQPHMVGIGPFIPHHDTPFAAEPAGTLELTLFMLGLLRLLLPRVLLPATTALGTISPDGREQGVLAGANVVMPNLSPTSVRAKYLLYDNKIAVDAEAAEGRELLERQMTAIGYRVVTARGDSRMTDI